MCLIEKARARARAGVGGETRRRAHPRARPGQWPGLGFSGEIPSRGPVADADKSAFPPPTCLLRSSPFLSPPLPSLSLTSPSLSSFAACLYLPSLALAIAIPSAAAVYIIVSCTKSPLSGGSLSPLHLVYLDSCRLTLLTLLSAIHQRNFVSTSHH